MDIDLGLLRTVEREKEIPFDELVSIIEQAILTAYAKHTSPTGELPEGARAALDRKHVKHDAPIAGAREIAAALTAVPAFARQSEPVETTPPGASGPDSLPIESSQAGENTEIVVTGSFIRGTPEDAALPVDVISADEIQKRSDAALSGIPVTLAAIKAAAEAR